MTATWEKKDDVLVHVQRSSQITVVEDAKWPDYLSPVENDGWESDENGDYQKYIPYGTPINDITKLWSQDMPYSQTNTFLYWNTDVYRNTTFTTESCMYPAWQTLIPALDPPKVPVNISTNFDDEVFGNYIGPHEFLITQYSVLQFNYEADNKLVFTDDGASDSYRVCTVEKNQDWFNVDISINGQSYGDYISEFDIENPTNIVINISYPTVTFVAGDSNVYEFGNGTPDGYSVIVEDNKCVAKKTFTDEVTCESVLSEWDGHDPTAKDKLEFASWASQGFVDLADRVLNKNLTWAAEYYNLANQTVFNFVAPEGEMFDYYVTLGDYSSEYSQLIMSGTANKFVDTFLLSHNMKAADNQMVVMGNDYLEYSYYVADGTTTQKVCGVIKPHFNDTDGHELSTWTINGDPLLSKNNLAPNEMYNVTYSKDEAILVTGTAIDVNTKLAVKDVDVKYVVSNTETNEETIIAQSKTDSNGKYLLRVPSNTPGKLVFSRIDSKKVTDPVDIDGNEDVTVDAKVSFKDIIFIYGSVQDQDGNTVDSDIEFYDPDGKLIQKTQILPNESFYVTTDLPANLDEMFMHYKLKAIPSNPSAGDPVETSLFLPTPEFNGYSVGTLYIGLSEPFTRNEAIVQPDPSSISGHDGFIVNGNYKGKEYKDEKIEAGEVFKFALYKFTKVSVEPWNNYSIHFVYKNEGPDFNPITQYDLTITPLNKASYSFNVWNCGFNLNQYGDAFNIGFDSLFSIDDRYVFSSIYKPGANVDFGPSTDEYFLNYDISFQTSNDSEPRYKTTNNEFAHSFPEGTVLSFHKYNESMSIKYCSSKQVLSDGEYGIFELVANYKASDKVYFDGWIINGEKITSDLDIVVQSGVEYSIKPSFVEIEDCNLSFIKSKEVAMHNFHCTLLSEDGTVIEDFDSETYKTVLHTGSILSINGDEVHVKFLRPDIENESKPWAADIKTNLFDPNYAFDCWYVNEEKIDLAESNEIVVEKDCVVMPSFKYIGHGDDPSPENPSNTAVTGDFTTQAFILCCFMLVLGIFGLQRKKS